MNETKTKIENIIFVVCDDLPILSPPVALARILMCPVREFQIVYRPEGLRFVLVRYAPWGDQDPFLPVPLVDFGERFFFNLRTFAEHLGSWSPRLDPGQQRRWSRVGCDLLNGFRQSIGALDLLTPEEADWLLETLWSLWAEPQGPGWLLAEVAAGKAAAEDACRCEQAAAGARRAEIEARARRERDCKRIALERERDRLLYGW